MSSTLTEVTKQEFYSKLNLEKRDIHPSIVGGWNDETGYTQEWRTQDGRRDLFGKTTGNGCGRNTYHLAGA